MRKISFLITAALTGLIANAQYTCDPSTSVVASQNPSSVEYMVLSNGAIQELEATGAKLTYIGPDADNGRNLWYWDNTFSAGDESYPRVDMEEGGYISVVVGTAGWSGAGLNFANPVDLSMFNEDTRLHIAYMTPTNNGPASIALILIDGNSTSPAKLALGDAFNDNGTVYPSIGPKINGDWQGVDISFADIKKLFPSFNYTNVSAWTGNIFSWLGGGVTGQTMAFDTLYFYNPGTASVGGIVVEDITFVVTDNTINVNGQSGIQLYSLSGRLVKSTNGCVIGINDLAKGVYIVKSGNKVRKIVKK